MHFSTDVKDGIIIVAFKGVCDYSFNKKSQERLISLVEANNKLIFDFSAITKIDMLFCTFINTLRDGKDITFIGTNDKIDEIFHTLQNALSSATNTTNTSKPHIFKQFFHTLGIFLIDFCTNIINFLQFCGSALWYFFKAIRHPSRFKLNAIFYHINESGFKALPIALLTAFIVSYAIALQGVLQLDKMGVPIMSVEIVAKLALREIGPFILAIVIAGRSSSSFSAQIGAMNLAEETYALKTMNLSVFDYLILPRILALVIVMPLLVFVADIISLYAAMLAVKVQIGISFSQYLERFYEFVSIDNFWVGVIKAPFFGAVIALVGCFRGLYAKGDTESVGKETTKSVLNAIFWVILINAIFSVITMRLNI